MNKKLRGGTEHSSADPIKNKVEYVKTQKQDRNHTCHWPGCGKQVPPAMWGCSTCWMKIPVDLRRRVWLAYRPGQEVDMRPSKEYLKVAREVQDWIKKQRTGD